jgi:shikimate dehydrogenase
MRKFGLIGKSLLHSRSKEYFLQKFTREHLSDCVYENYQLDDLKDIRSLILNEPYLLGLNVTTPYKIEIMKYVDDISPMADSFGAVNCVKISRNGKDIRLTGYNTDAAAFRETLKPLIRKVHNNALILGTGGAARAVCHALKNLNVDYTLVSRDEKSGVLTYSALMRQTIVDHKMIINATPVGMFPAEDQCPPLPYKYLTSKHLLYDLVYNPEETMFLKKGIEAGAQIKNGLEMLQLQAEMSWKVWNGRAPYPYFPSPNWGRGNRGRGSNLPLPSSQPQ